MKYSIGALYIHVTQTHRPRMRTSALGDVSRTRATFDQPFHLRSCVYVYLEDENVNMFQL